jgi:hypothetical protein
MLTTRDLVSRYRAMAESLGFEEHIAWAKAMVEGGNSSVRNAPTMIDLIRRGRRERGQRMVVIWLALNRAKSLGIAGIAAS